MFYVKEKINEVMETLKICLLPMTALICMAWPYTAMTALRN